MPPSHTQPPGCRSGNPNGLPVNVRSGTTINNLSVVTRLDCGPHSFLFTGDIEGGVITRLHADPWLTARIVKVPHHGARSSLHTDWVGHSHPDIAVISVGRTNFYGHPVLPWSPTSSFDVPPLHTDVEEPDFGQ